MVNRGLNHLWFLWSALCHWVTWVRSDPRLLWWVQTGTKHRVLIKYFVYSPGDILMQAMTRAKI